MLLVGIRQIGSRDSNCAFKNGIDNLSRSFYFCFARWFDCCQAKNMGRPNNQKPGALDVSLPEIRIPSVPETAARLSDESRQKESANIPLPELASDAAFQDLRISGLLKERCFVTQTGLVRIQLELSEYPPLGWSYIFLTVWESVDYPAKARVGIEEDTLWVECEAAEFKNRDYPQIQNAIEDTNARYRAVLQEQIAAEARREELDRDTLEVILGLELDTIPRPQVKRRSRVFRAYLAPIMWSACSAVWILAGWLVWIKIPASEWSFIREPLLIIIWSWILYALINRAISQFRQRYRIRKFVLRKRPTTIWPHQYVDRRGKE